MSVTALDSFAHISYGSKLLSEFLNSLSLDLAPSRRFILVLGLCLAIVKVSCEHSGIQSYGGSFRT